MKSFTVSNEFETFKIQEYETFFTGNLEIFRAGQVVSETMFFYDKRLLPEQLNTILKEHTEGTLKHKHQEMLWNLIDERYEI